MRKICSGQRELTSLAEVCEEAVARTLRQHGSAEGWEGRAGGYLCVADAKNGLPLITMLVGEVPLEKAPKYLEFCQEKAARLAGHPDHQASWQSRNPEKNQWGGAIRFGDKILSFSGLPERGDESAMLLVMAQYGDKNYDASWQIARLTDNQCFTGL